MVAHGVSRCYRVLQGVIVADSGIGAREAAPLIFSPDLDQRGGKICFLETAPPPNFISRSGSVSVLYGVTKGYMVLHGLKGRYTVAHGVTR